MRVDLYNPAEHETTLRAWCARDGIPWEPDVLPDEGLVASDDAGPVAAVFVYKDPSASCAFVDNLLTAKDRSPFVLLAAISAGLHVLAHRCTTLDAVAFTTTSAFVAKAIERSYGLAASPAFRTTVRFNAHHGGD